jgi:hypothetical protein
MMFDIPLDTRIEVLHPSDAALDTASGDQRPMFTVTASSKINDPVDWHLKRTR